MARRYELTAKRFALIEDLLPARGKRGGRWNDHPPPSTASSGGCTRVLSGMKYLNATASGRASTTALTIGGLMARSTGCWRDCTCASTRRAGGLCPLGHRCDQHPRQPVGGRGSEGKNQPYDPAVQALGRSRGGWGTKVYLVVDGGGIPLAATVTAGQAHESKQAAATLEAVRLPNGKGGLPADPRSWRATRPTAIRGCAPTCADVASCR